MLIDVVGGGGMGTVYRATDLKVGREVAVKVLDPRFDPAKDPAYRERFLREARLSTRLSHGNIVEVLDTGESDGVHFIAMELLQGQTLAKLIETEKVLGWERSLRLVRQMAAGLSFAHELGLVHRDLKPANCFVLGAGPTEWVKLLDFGLAKPMLTADGAKDDEVTRTSVVMGSPTYMAPEQARGEASVQSDVYAMGVMLFRMLAGQVPFVGKTAIEVIVHHIQTPLPWLEEVNPGNVVPIELELVMRRCLEKDPRARFPSVQAMVAALDEAELDTRRDPAQRAATLQMAIARRHTPAAPSGPTGPLQAQLLPVPPSEPMFSNLRQPEKAKNRGAIAGVGLGVLVLGSLLVWKLAQPSAVVAPPAPVPEAKPVVPAPTASADPVPVPHGPVTFRINSIPTGATVKVGSKVMGITPAIFALEADDTGEATAELTLELKGYQTITFIATSPGPRFDLVQRLQKGTGKIQLSHVEPTKLEKDDPVFVPMVLPTAPPPTKSSAPVATTPAPVVVPAPDPAPPVTVAPAPAPAPPNTSGIVPTDQLTSRPRMLSGEAPRSPVSARVARVEGTSVARCVVTPKGKLEGCHIVKSVPLMDEAILDSLKTRVYEPGRVGTEAVSTEISVVIRVTR
jgi:eukaryotic-like serine/threonine-protein kinase